MSTIDYIWIQGSDLQPGDVMKGRKSPAYSSACTKTVIFENGKKDIVFDYQKYQVEQRIK